MRLKCLNKTEGARQNGFTLLEALIVVAIILILAAMAIPGELRSRQVARRSVIITDLQTMHDELNAYEMMCGGYPATLPNGSSAPTGCASSSTANADAVSTSTSDSTANAADPVPIIMSGYHFTYSPSDFGSDGSYHSYVVTADPLSGGRIGNEFYFSDQSGVIRVHLNAQATALDPAFAH